MIEVNDEVELTKNRIGIIRYKGPLCGKNGMYYGIELTRGTGKHGGLFRGKRYFVCHRTKGIFVDKRQILYKFAYSNKKTDVHTKKKRSKKSQKLLARKSSENLGVGKFKLPRKTGPSYAKKSSLKTAWKPPEFMQDVLNEIEYDGEFLGERLGQRGKFQAKTKYEKAGYLPHAKLDKAMYRPDEWSAFLKGINDESLRIEMEKQMKEWEKELKPKKSYLDEKEREDMENTRIALEEEIKSLQFEKDELINPEEKQLMREKEEEEIRLHEERLFLLKVQQEKIRKEMDDDDVRMATLEAKQQELQDVKRELEEEKEKLKFQKKNSEKELENNKEKELNRQIQKQLKEEKKKLKEERERMEYELDKKMREMEELAREKEKDDQERRKLLANERKKLEKTHKLLEEQRKQQMEDEERERNAWEDRRIKIEQMKIKEREDREKRLKEKMNTIINGNSYNDNNDNNDSNDSNDSSSEDIKRDLSESPIFKGGYDSSSSDRGSGGKGKTKKKSKKKRKKRSRKRRKKRKEPKRPKKDYKIFFSVNIETDETNENDIIENKSVLRYLLSDLFETRSEKEVFEIKSQKKGNGFKLDFGIIIATSMHPADYIDTFDDLTMDGSFQETVKEGFDLNKDIHVHIWEARYEKVDPKKQRKRKKYY